MTIGSKAVAASGIASVIHHAPISTVVAATMRRDWYVYSPSGSAPVDSITVSTEFDGKNTYTKTARIRPTNGSVRWRYPGCLGVPLPPGSAAWCGYSCDLGGSRALVPANVSPSTVSSQNEPIASVAQ